MTQAGLPLKWMGAKPLKKGPGSVHCFSFGHLLPALFLLGVGYLGGILVFIAEKAFFKWSRRKMK